MKSALLRPMFTRAGVASKDDPAGFLPSGGQGIGVDLFSGFPKVRVDAFFLLTVRYLLSRLF
jgi:hypothetical protein